MSNASEDRLTRLTPSTRMVNCKIEELPSKVPFGGTEDAGQSVNCHLALIPLRSPRKFHGLIGFRRNVSPLNLVPNCKSSAIAKHAILTTPPLTRG